MEDKTCYYYYLIGVKKWRIKNKKGIKKWMIEKILISFFVMFSFWVEKLRNRKLVWLRKKKRKKKMKI